MNICVQKVLQTLGVWLCCAFILGVPIAQAQQITKLEYFFNQDPGFGKGTNVPITPGEDVTKSFQVNINALSSGFHQLYLRTKNANGKWSMTSMRTFYKEDLTNLVSAGQISNVTKGEFFFNTDPGFGKATGIPLSPGQDLSQVTFAADITSLLPGFHQLYLRFKNANGQWSMTTMRTFYKDNLSAVVPGTTLANITKGEYFFNSDPGFGKGTDISLTPGQDLNNVTFTADITKLAPGFHKLYLRFKNAQGYWGMTSMRTFYKDNLSAVVPGTTLANVTKGEYYFNTDPGFGKGTNIAFTPGQDINNVNFTADITSLPPGFHQLYLRFKNANGQWGMTSVRTFFKDNLSGVTSEGPLANITKGEYYVDTDPGYGKGISIPFTPAPDITDLTFALDMNNVSVGNHKLYVRFQDANGRWSATSAHAFEVKPPSELIVNTGSVSGPLCASAAVVVPFTVNAAFGSNNIFTAELSDANGNFNNPVAIGTLAGTNSGTINAIVPANTLTGTNYRIRVVTSSPVRTSEPNAIPLVVNRVPENFAVTGASSTCVGFQTYTTNLIASGETTYSWQVSGGGTMNTNGNAVNINWTTPGTHTVKLIATNSCGNSTEKTLTVKVNSAAPTLVPTVTTNGRWMYASAAPAGAEVESYQWYENGGAIVGATSSSYYAYNNATYVVAFKNACGVGLVSSPVTYTTFKQNQTITFNAIPEKTFGDEPFSLNATASSGLGITYSITSGPATISENTLTITGAGTVTVLASQAGNDDFNPASASRSFTVTKANQTITFAEIPTKTVNDSPFALEATSTSGLPVVFQVLSGRATITGNLVTLTGVGPVTIEATQAGNSNYKAATAVQHSFTVSGPELQAQTITFPVIADKTFGDVPVSLGATASSGLVVAYQVVSGPGALSGTSLRITGAGIITVRATQAGNATFQAAPPVDIEVTIRKANQTISLVAIPNKTLGDSPFAVGATATSGLPISLGIVTNPATGVASLTGNTISILGIGSVTITATQAGNNNYHPATAVEHTFNILAAPLTPDLAVQTVAANKTELGPNELVTVSWQVANVGKAQSAVNWTEKIYAQSPDGQNRTLLKQGVFANNSLLTPNQSLPRTDQVTIPAQLNIGDQGVFVVELIPGNTVQEGPNSTANNTSVQQTAWNLKKLLALELSGTQLTEGVGEITATAKRSGSLANSLIVGITFDQPSRFTFPATVTIPAGQAGISFKMAARENETIDGTLNDTLRITATGFQSAKAGLIILDNDKPSLAINNLPRSAMEGENITFRVTTNLAPAQPLQVFLTSSSKTRFPVPASVTIPAGALSADVAVALAQDNIPEIDLEVSITAGAANHYPVSASLEVQDDDLPNIELIVQTNLIPESGGLYATKATLRRAANSNSLAFNANLSTDLANTLILPATISLAAGENEKTFNVGVVDNTLADGDREVKLTAAIFVSSCGCNAPGTSSGSVSATITVTDNDGPALQLTTTQLTLPEGVSNAGLLRITRNTGTVGNLTVNLTSSNTNEATISAIAIIPAGKTFVEVPITTINDGISDGNKQVYFQATANGFSAGSAWVLVSDQNKPDLQIASVNLSSPVIQAMALFNYQVSVKNTGFATAPTRVLVRGYLSKDNVIGAGDSLISEDYISEAIPAGQTVQLVNAVKIPDLPGQYKVLYWVNPDLTLTELLANNNTSVPVNLTINPDYTATANVQAPYFLKGVKIPVTGSATRSNGSVAANKQVEVYIITNGLRRTIMATTDEAGNFTAEFTPLANEAGRYAVGASFPGIGATAEQDAFDILGVRINDGKVPQFRVTLNETLEGTLSVQNLSSKSLKDFSLVPVTLPNRAQIKFDTVASFAGNASINLPYKIVGSALSSGTNFEVAGLKAVSEEGTLQNQDAFYFCQAPNAYVVADISKIDISASQSKGERQIEFRIVNKGMGATGEVTISLPQVNWLSSVTPKKIPSMATGDTAVVILKFVAAEEIPFNFPVKGNIGVGTQNGNALQIPFTFEKKSETAGTVKVTVTNQFTYYTEGAPKVPGARVQIKNYFTGAIYAEGVTNADGIFTGANVPEGRHRVVIEKDKHLPYNGTLTINPGETTEESVFLNYQAITFSWSVVPTAVEDAYDIELVTKFETHVPMPVVTIDMPKTMPQLSGSQVYAFNATLTNHGLITAKDVALNLPTTDPEYEFVTNYTPGDLLAQQSIQVPVIMRRRDTAQPEGIVERGGMSVQAVSAFLGMDPAQYRTLSSGGGNCQDFAGVVYWYTCSISTGLWQKGGTLFSYEGRRCGSDGGGNGGGGLDKNVIGAYADAFPSCAICPSPDTWKGDTEWTHPVWEKKSCVDCIKKLISTVKGCVGLKKWKCAKGAIESIWVCGNTSSSSRTAGTFDVAQTLSLMNATQTSAVNSELGAIFQQLAEDMQIGVDAYQAVEDKNLEYFGDLINSDAFADLDLLMRPYTSTLDSIRPAAQASILNAMLGYEIEAAAIQAIISRWNTSIYARSLGIMEPNATYPNIINWNVVQEYEEALAEANNLAIDKGFESAFELFEKTYKDLNDVLDAQQEAVCASVTVKFNQRLTMTREAFEGTLDIFNGHPTDAMESLKVDIRITDENGVPSNGLFEIQTKSLTNISDVTGTGAIGAQQNGVVTFLFIPEQGAAPTTQKKYKFGGTVHYWDPYAQAMVTMPLADVTMTVNPSPNLMLHYFMERNILGDDALTKEVVEPMVPAELAVMVENQGYGPAVNMAISSAQPKIVENEKGLAINFNIIGSNFQGQPKNLGVTNINFGTIPALQTRIGQWYFTSTLLGKFVSYEASVVHANSFGNPELSLVKGVKLHELTKSIRAYGKEEDNINDFLVNDVFDIHDTPDIIYFSQGNRTEKVFKATSGSFSAPVSGPTFTNTLTVTAAELGWNYIKLNDPGNRQYELVSVTRNDGQVIPLSNAWLTFVTLPVSRPPVYENKFHFVDQFASNEPVTYTVVWKPRSLDVPKVVSIEGVPEQVTSEQVQKVTVKFSKSIDPATFTHEDLNLTFQGGPNIMNNSVVVTQLDTASFEVNIAALTSGNGFYNLTVQAANVQDIYGISGAVGKQATWTQFLTVPAVQAFQGIPEGNTAASFDKVQVLFNLPIDLATATPERFTILKDGVAQSGTVVIDSVRADKKLFYLSGLDNILSESGTYQLVVDLANIKSVDQVEGVQSQSVTMNVDKDGPVLVSLEKSNTGGLDAQHTPFINIQFNEDVKGFNTAAVSLTRNDEVLPLNIAQLANTDLKNWTAGNFGMLTYPDGDYVFTVNMGAVKDAIGNSGSGLQQVSWSVNRNVILTVSDLKISPDLGYSDSDGVTSGLSMAANFNVSEAASQVVVSQVDAGGESVLATVTNIAAGAVSIPVTLHIGGNTGIKVTATGVNGGVGTATRNLTIDQVPLSAQWLFNNNQVLAAQIDAIDIAFNAKLLSDAGLISALQFRRNGTNISLPGLRVEKLNDTEYRVSGLHVQDLSSSSGNYQLSLNLQPFSKYNSGMGGTGEVSVAWTVQPTNQAPIAKAGTDITVNAAGLVLLNGSASTDPDANELAFEWVAPAGIILSDASTATPSFTVTAADQGKSYSFLLIVRDGSLFSTDVVNVTVNLNGDLANQFIAFTNIPDKTFGDAPVALEAIASSGLPVTFEVVEGPATLTGNRLTLTGAGVVRVRALQEGNGTYRAATPVERRFEVNKGVATLTLSETQQVYNGSARRVVVTTIPAGLPVELTYDGKRETLVNAGAYEVVATVIHANYQGTARGTLVIEKASQIISAPILADMTMGDQPVAIQATSSSGLPVSVEVISESIRWNGSHLIAIGPGGGCVTFTQPGNNNFLQAPPVERCLHVNPATGEPEAQTISFTEIPDKAYGDAAFALDAVASSGLPVSFTVVSGPASISGNLLSITGVGPVTVRATQLGNDRYKAAPVVDRTFNVSKAVQLISFTTIPDKTKADKLTFDLAATASSGLPVTFSVVSGNATIQGKTIKLNAYFIGPVTVRASQGGSALFHPVTTEQTFEVTKIPQSISFATIPDKVFGVAPFALEATATSGLGVSFAVLEGRASVAGNMLTVTGPGQVRVKAMQWGNGDYASAEPVIHTFNVTAPNSQSINFAAIPNKVYGQEPFELEATATSGLPVSFRLISGLVTINGNKVTINSPSKVEIEATQAGNFSYNAATPVRQTFTVTKAPQSISFAAIPDKVFGVAPFALEATATSGLGVSFAVLEGRASVAGNMLTVTGPGQVRVKAMQWGNGDYASAEPVIHTFNVTAPNSQLARFVTPHDQSFVQEPAGLDAYPNPFVQDLTITFLVEQDEEKVVMEVLTLEGKPLKVLHNGPALASIKYTYTFSGEDVASGVYLCRLTYNNKSVYKRVVLVK